MPEGPGTLLNARYQLEAELGGGGMGVVYRAHDTLLDRDVAVKVLSAAELGTEGRVRLLREAQAAAGLNHPNIVTVHDVGEADAADPAGPADPVGPMPYVVMELVEGPSLDERRPGSLEETVAIARQVCAALEHAHTRGIVHRDLKPENILLAADPRAGAGVSAKLVDFGLARSVASRTTAEGVIAGTVFYLAPELALGQAYDGRADLYALGVMLYELTSGRLPFLADDPLAVISQHLHAPPVPPCAREEGIPPALDGLILRLLSKDPQDRPASAAEVLQALEAPDILDRKAMPTRELSVLERIERGRLVARERELSEARAAWRRAAAGEGGMLLVSGEPGIGKTRLVRELCTEVQVTGDRVLVGECYAEGGAPYDPFAQILRGAFRDGAGEQLAAALPDFVLADLLTLAPSLRLRFPAVPANPPLDAKAEQQRLFENVVAFCQALCDRAPLLLVLEDAHWADGGSLALLRHLARRTRRQPLLLVATYREVELDQTRPFQEVLLDLNRERLATRLRLSRLDREGTGEMLGALFAEEITPEFLAGIYTETEGNPFFVEEVCKALVESGQVYFADGAWDRLDMEELEIPQSVRVAIQSRVRRLPSQVQDTLCLAAIVGREFDFETLAQASELDEEALVDGLEGAERAQLIGELSSEAGGTFGFTHGLIPVTVAEGLSGLRRRRLHRRIADVIEALHPDDGTRLAGLAYHYSQAGVEDKALHYLTEAGDWARASYANEDAIRYYSKALEYVSENSPQRLDLLAARAGVYDLVARWDTQRTDLEAMLALAEALEDDGRRCDALLSLAECLWNTGAAGCRGLAKRAAETALKIGDLIREGRALRLLGWLDTMTGHYARSRGMLEAALARFQGAGQPSESAACLSDLSLTLAYLGEFVEALDAAAQAAALSREAGDLRLEATSLRRMAIAYSEQGRHATALPAVEAALALHREIGDRHEECHALMVLGIMLGELGKLEEAAGVFQQVLEIAEEIGSASGISWGVSNMVLYALAPQGEYEAGLAFLQTWLSKARQAKDADLASHFQRHTAWLLFALGQLEAALELAQTVHSDAGRILEEAPIIETPQLIGFCQAQLGRFHQARESIRAGLEKAEKAGELVHAIWLGHVAYVAYLEGDQVGLRAALEEVPQCDVVLRPRYVVFHRDVARLHLALGAVDEALESSSKVMQEIETFGEPYFVEQYYLTHARVLRALGRDAEADDYLQRAYERVMLVASKIQDEGLRQSWLGNVRDNREIVAEWEARGKRA